MAKPIHAQPTTLAPPWQQSEPTYTVGKSHIDGMDHVAREMERKWGVGRLRLLVPADLRAKFDSQMQKTNHAIWHGELEDVKIETQRMINAWNRLDHVAEVEVGAEKLSPVVWEAKMPDGRILAFVRTSEEAWRVYQSEASPLKPAAEGRKVTTYSLDQVVAILAENERRIREEGAELRHESHVVPVKDRGNANGWEDQIPF